MAKIAQIERLVLECRFADGFLYLDRAGLVWKDFYNRAKDDLDVRQVNPQTSQFVFKSINSGVTFSPKNFAVTTEFPKSDLKAFEELCGYVTKVMVERLEPSSFVRVGYRATFNYSFADKEASEAAFLRLKLLADPKDALSSGGSLLGLKGSKPINGSMALRVETDEIGRLLQVRTEERKTEVNLIAFDGDIKGHTSNVLVIDIDSYTKKPTGAGGFDPVAFVKGHHKEIVQVSQSIFERTGQ
jgi:hypothetical protein